MAKKGTKNTSVTTTGTTGTTGKKKNGKNKKAGKRTKLFKPKKGKEILKGLASVGVNAGINKLMDAGFIGRIKKADFTKNGVFDEKAYNAKIEQMETLKGATNIGIFLSGVTNSLPKNMISAEYLDINRLEQGIQTVLGKVDKKRIAKNDKAKPIAPYFQGVDDFDPSEIEGIENDDEVNYLIEGASMIESAIQAGESEVAEEVAYLQSSAEFSEVEEEEEEDSKEPIKYVFQGIEGLNEVIPGIEEEN